MLTALLHDRNASVQVPAIVWGMTIAAYICMCALSMFHIARREERYGDGVSALAQGLLLSVMSLQLGVAPLSWIGLVIFMAGLAQAFYYATRTSSVASPQRDSSQDDAAGVFKRVDSLIEKLELPICYTDGHGVIAGATASFLEAVGRKETDVIGALVSDFIPVDADEAILESGKWWITQKKEGARYYFSLRPTQDGKPARPSLDEFSQHEDDGVGIYDGATGFYNDAYRKIRGPEEVARAQRYKRPLSGLLIELLFEPGADVNLSRDQVAMLDSAFKTKVQDALRTTDCGFLMADGRVQILLPETPQAGAKTLLSRIVTLPQDVFDEAIRAAVHPKVRGGSFFYNGASRMEYGVFSAALEESFSSSKNNAPEPTGNNQAA
jgi:PAS domain-containing protein